MCAFNDECLICGISLIYLMDFLIDVLLLIFSKILTELLLINTD